PPPPSPTLYIFNKKKAYYKYRVLLVSEMSIRDIYHSVYAVIPPVTALLNSKTISRKVAAFPELGMEAFHQLEIVQYPVIIAAAHGKSIYDSRS
ncbi:MAG: fumarate hydratase C-terminal domain-containing protein, partial [Lachnospiraceae bacterium]|nr:fumarate hydratase C-terminal domain-containing protein [Lachnospiraceae bacterium]